MVSVAWAWSNSGCQTRSPPASRTTAEDVQIRGNSLCRSREELGVTGRGAAINLMSCCVQDRLEQWNGVTLWFTSTSKGKIPSEGRSTRRAGEDTAFDMPSQTQGLARFSATDPIILYLFLPLKASQSPSVPIFIAQWWLLFISPHFPLNQLSFSAEGILDFDSAQEEHHLNRDCSSHPSTSLAKHQSQSLVETHSKKTIIPSKGH